MSKLTKAVFVSVVALCAAAVAHAAPPPSSVPEIDPTMAGGAMALILGTVLILVDKARGKR